MKNTFLFIQFLWSTLLYSQVGINTAYPIGIFHIDAKKDNVDTPNSMQFHDDFLVAERDGSVTIGGMSRTGSKLEINSGIPNVSGLRFRNLNSSSPSIISDVNLFLGVDSEGNVIVSEKDLNRQVTTLSNNITSYKGSTKNQDGSTNVTLTPFSFKKTSTDVHTAANPYKPSIFLPGSEVIFTIPAGRSRAVFMNFMMAFGLTRVGSSNADGSETFGAEIIITNTDTSTTFSSGVSQNTQVPSILPTRQIFALNYITNLPAGNYSAKIRINTIRFLFANASSNLEKTITFTPLQYAYNISYFES